MLQQSLLVGPWASAREAIPPSIDMTTDGGRLDTTASGFWGGGGGGEMVWTHIFYVHLFNPNVQGNVLSSLPSLYRRHECQKWAKCEQRIRDVERSTFFPLIWSTLGGAGPAATRFLKCLADKLSEKTEEPFCTTMGGCDAGLALLSPGRLWCASGDPAHVPVNLAVQSNQHLLPLKDDWRKAPTTSFILHHSC